MPERAYGPKTSRVTPFEKVLQDFVVRTGSRPPCSVYSCHPAFDMLVKALVVKYLAVFHDKPWAQREANQDAARLLYYFTRSQDGALLYDGRPASDRSLAEHLMELRHYKMRRQLQDRARSRSFGDPATERPFSDLVAPSQCEVFETFAYALVSNCRPRGPDTSTLGRAYDLLRMSYAPSSKHLVADIRWGKDEAYTPSAAERVFLEATHTRPEGWMADIAAMAKQIEQEAPMHIQLRTPADRGLKLVRVGRLEAKEPDYLIDGLIEKDSTITIFGDPACGKSFLSLDISMCVSTGTPFHGREVKRGPVVYLAGEGHSGLVRRVQAWCRQNGVDKDRADLFLSNKAPQLLNRSSMEELSAAVSEAIKEAGTPSMVFVDTVARAFGGGDENSTKDMSAFISALDAIRARFGCTIVLVHHSGHGDKQRARGSMAMRGAVDAEYRVEKKGKTITVENHKMKDGPPPPILQFQLDEIVLGSARNGKPITSAVLRETAHFDENRPKKLTANQQLGSDTYEETVRQHGTLRDDRSFAGIHIDAWREEFYRKHTGDNSDTKRTAFRRARDELVKLGRLRVDNDIYFPAGDFAAIDELRYAEMIAKRDTGQ